MGRQYLVVDDHPLVQRAITDTLGEIEPDCEVRLAGRLSSETILERVDRMRIEWEC